jgi:hypothetical protein
VRIRAHNGGVMPRAFALALPLLLAGCVLPQALSPPVGPSPRPVDRRLVLGDPPGPTVTLEGDWRFDGAKYCTSGGDVLLHTPTGPIMLFEANFCATQRPASITGDARVPLPAIGFLASLGVSGAAPRGRLSLGRDLRELQLGAHKLPADPARFYLMVDYEGRYDAALGSASLSTGDGPARMIVEPEGPAFYIGGDLGGLLPGSWKGVAIGFSPAGALPWASEREIFDGTTAAVRKLSGHLLVQGAVPIGDFPLTATGRLVVDLDADDDGQLSLMGDAKDLGVAGDVMVRVGYQVAGFDVGLDLARASILYDGSLYLAATLPAAALAGTPLVAFQPASDLSLTGVYRSAKDFVLQARGDGRMLGFPLSAVELTLGSSGVGIKGRTDLPGMGPVDLAGTMAANGSYSLTGRADLSAAGLPLRGAEVTLSPGGVRITALVNHLGLAFKVAGTIQPNGQRSLSGTVAMKAKVLTGRATVLLDGGAPRVSVAGKVCAGPACVDVPETEVDAAGNVCPSFPVVGRQCVKVL